MGNIRATSRPPKIKPQIKPKSIFDMMTLAIAKSARTDKSLRSGQLALVILKLDAADLIPSWIVDDDSLHLRERLQ